jgi:hypothetical protein
MPKKGKKKKGLGAEKTLAKLAKKQEREHKKALEEAGEDDVESILDTLQRKDLKTYSKFHTSLYS